MGGQFFYVEEWGPMIFKKAFPKLLCQMSEVGDLEAMKQILSYIKQSDVSDFPDLLCEMSEEGELNVVIQIFAYLKHENMEMDMEVKNCDNEVIRTPLFRAATKGRHQICEYLITKERANIEARDYYQQTALIMAACYNRTEVIKVLLHHNANVKAEDKYGTHAACWAAKNGHLDALKMLVEKDGDVIDLKGTDGETPLIAAAAFYPARVDACKYLVEEKIANVNLKDNTGKTALQHARDPRIIEILKNKGAK